MPHTAAPPLLGAHPLVRLSFVGAVLLIVAVLAHQAHGTWRQPDAGARDALLALDSETLAGRMLAWDGAIGAAYGDSRRERLLCEGGDTSGQPLALQDLGRLQRACAIALTMVWEAEDPRAALDIPLD